MFAALKDVLLEVYTSKLLSDLAKNNNNNDIRMSSNGVNNENAQFVGPYKLEKTLGKGQTGKSWVRGCEFLVSGAKKCLILTYE